LKKQEVNQRRQHIAASKEASVPSAYQAHPVMTRKEPFTFSVSKIGPSSGHSDGIGMKKQEANQSKENAMREAKNGMISPMSVSFYQ
jgi:hypothetical protein